MAPKRNDFYSENDRLDNEDADFQNPYSLSSVPKSEHEPLLRELNNGPDDAPPERTFVTKAFLELPLEYVEGGDVVVDKRIQTNIRFEIPPRAGNGKWSSSFGGKCLVRGPLGCATGSLALNYHLSDCLLIRTGMDVGDSSRIHVGLKRRRWSLTLYSLPSESGAGAKLCVSKSTSLVDAQLSLDSSSFANIPRAQLSVSTRAVHKTTVRGGWSGSKPKMEIELRPRLSKHVFGRISCGFNSAGLWHVASSIHQSLTAIHVATKNNIGELGLGIQLNKTFGLQWILFWTHGGINIRVPLTIAKRPFSLLNGLQAVFFACLSKVIHDSVFDLWYSSVMDEAEIEHNQRQLSMLQQEEARRDAQQQQELMARQATARLKAEEEKNGLVILQATYSVLGGQDWDVTVPLRFWTVDSTLELPASSKQQFLGFCNILPPEKPRGETHNWWNLFFNTSESTTSDAEAPTPTLRVKYQYSGDVYIITVKDDETLILPNSNAILIEAVQ